MINIQIPQIQNRLLYTGIGNIGKGVAYLTYAIGKIIRAK